MVEKQDVAAKALATMALPVEQGDSRLNFGYNPNLGENR
jgi:hypothetical protein